VDPEVGILFNMIPTPEKVICKKSISFRQAVKKLLADARRQDERKILEAKKKRKKKQFSQELEDFLKLRYR
jgi:hypothetical protein